MNSLYYYAQGARHDYNKQIASYKNTVFCVQKLHFTAKTIINHHQQKQLKKKKNINTTTKRYLIINTCTELTDLSDTYYL